MFSVFFFFEHPIQINKYIYVLVCVIILHMCCFSFYNNSNSPWKLITYLYFALAIMFCIFPKILQSFFPKPLASSVTSRSQAVHMRPVRRSFELHSPPQFDFHVSKPYFPGTSNVRFFICSSFFTRIRKYDVFRCSWIIIITLTRLQFIENRTIASARISDLFANPYTTLNKNTLRNI